MVYTLQVIETYSVSHSKGWTVRWEAEAPVGTAHHIKEGTTTENGNYTCTVHGIISVVVLCNSPCSEHTSQLYGMSKTLI